MANTDTRTHIDGRRVLGKAVVKFEKQSADYYYAKVGTTHFSAYAWMLPQLAEQGITEQDLLNGVMIYCLDTRPSKGMGDFQAEFRQVHFEKIAPDAFTEGESACLKSSN